MVGDTMVVEASTKFGNYLSYLRYTLPTAKQLFGEHSFRKKKLRMHQQKIENENILNSYRLSIHGILYCIATLELTEREIDIMASKYSEVLPMLFGKWE